VRIVRGPLRGFHGIVESLSNGRPVEIGAPDTLPGVRIRISAELLELLRT
jgi:hypothetical protein